MKKLTSVLLLLILSFSLVAATIPTAAAADIVVETSLPYSVAEDLKNLHLFYGISEADFDLDRAPTRVEALVMLIRLLGKEDEALTSAYTHPFTDVPMWADKYIAYAYGKGLTKGVSANKFGTDNATSAMYFTFVLRALGYSDTNGADFTWDNPYELAMKTEISPISIDTKNFMRSDVVMISYAALSAILKNDTITLADKLISEGVFTIEEFSYSYDKLKITSPEETFKYNQTLRDFIVLFGQCESYEENGVTMYVYYLDFYNEDETFRFSLNYSPSTGVLSAIEEYLPDKQTPTFSTNLYFAGMGTAYNSAKVIVGVKDGSAQALAASFIKPQEYTSGTALDFYAWRPTTTEAPAVYTQDVSEATAGDMVSDILETLKYILSEYYIGFSLGDLGYKKF